MKRNKNRKTRKQKPKSAVILESLLTIKANLDELESKAGQAEPHVKGI